jgi:putative SOS response-associated peptidase YedK
MCSSYTPPKPKRIEEYFGVHCVAPDLKPETYPGYLAPVIRLADDGSDTVECVTACFGMVPHWADLKLARHTYNARSETVDNKPTFRHAFSKRQFCIIPAESFFEPNYESGKAVRWKIERADAQPMGLAGIWEWRPNGGPEDQPLISFSMLTINADAHPLMQRFHKPEDEKRMVVLLQPEQFQDWLHAMPADVPNYLQPCPADWLKAEPAPRVAMSKAKPAQIKPMPHSEPRSLWELD